MINTVKQHLCAKFSLRSLAEARAYIFGGWEHTFVEPGPVFSAEFAIDLGEWIRCGWVLYRYRVKYLILSEPVMLREAEATLKGRVGVDLYHALDLPDVPQLPRSGGVRNIYADSGDPWFVVGGNGSERVYRKELDMAYEGREPMAEYAAQFREKVERCVGSSAVEAVFKASRPFE